MIECSDDKQIQELKLIDEQPNILKMLSLRNKFARGDSLQDWNI